MRNISVTLNELRDVYINKCSFFDIVGCNLLLGEKIANEALSKFHQTTPTLSEFISFCRLYIEENTFVVKYKNRILWKK